MRQLFLFLAGCMISFLTHGQAEKQWSVSFKNEPLLSLIHRIEGESSYRFYFIESWIDSVDVTVSANNAELPALLKSALENTNIGFFIQGQKVILTPGFTITNNFDSLHADANSYASRIGIASEQGNDYNQTGASDNAVRQIGKKSNSQRSTYRLSGSVKEKHSDEPLTGALVYQKSTNNAVLSDQYGIYSLSLPPGEHEVIVDLIGMKSISQKVNVLGDGKLDFMMEESVTQLKEVVVESDVDVNVSNVQMGMSKIDVRTMKNIPKILGENDLMKVATTLPGVKSVGEGASGLNVRGGHADQNLVLLNEATIYNTSHLLGFFSVFNPDAIRSFELFKSGIPVQHGGRLSSTFELLMRDGNKKKVSGQGGIGPITSHLTLEAPIIKDKTSVMAGGRTTYSNWVLRAIPQSVLENTSASFYDVFARITHAPNDKNTFFLSLYNSYDRFNLSSDTLFSYSNKLGSFQWRHVFSRNVDAVLSVTHSQYNYDINHLSVPEEAFKIGFSVAESNVKWEFNQSYKRHRFTYGVQSRLYNLNPGFIEKGNESSIVKVRQVDAEKGLESSAFIADNFEINRNLAFYYGLRYSFFSALGPRSIYTYAAGVPKSDVSIQDTLQYGGNEVLGNYHGPEYRLSLRYKLSDESSLKASYNRTRQYIHMLSNTVSVSPTDTWKLSDPNVLPQVADQASAGYYKDFKNDVFEFSAEVYYKWIQNILDFKTGATLLVNENIDQQILQGKGKAYGLELLLRKKSGKLNGWVGYAYSRTFIQLNSPIRSEQVNFGNYFPANYDKPHDLTLVTNYKITRRYSVAFNFAYSTGRPITYPTAAYRVGNTYRIHYSDRNAFRIPDYIRADVGFNIEGNHKIRKLAHSFWSISIYNLFGRNNPYSVYFAIEGEKIKAYKLSIFGAPIPTVTYHFRF